MKEITGYCKFCGQAKLIKVTDATEQDGADELVTSECHCEEARAYQYKLEEEARAESARLSARGTIFELFHEDYPVIEQLLCASINHVVDGPIKKITVTTDGKTTAKMTFTGGEIKVTREDKSVRERKTEV